MMIRMNETTLSNGLRMPFVEVGDPAGRPVLFLHGYSDSLRSFDCLLPHLPTGIRAIVPSQRGHGEAGRPDHGYAMRDFADDVARLMDALGVARAVLVGHSMGAIVAARLAIDRPERVAALVLMGGFAALRGNPGVEEMWRDVVSTLQDPVPVEFALEFQRSTIARPVSPAMLDMVVGESLKLPARVWQAVLQGLRQVDFTSELPSITAPTLVLWGDQDNFSGRAEQEALAAATRARLVALEGTGHALHWEDPERVAAEIAGFLATLD